MSPTVSPTHPVAVLIATADAALRAVEAVVRAARSALRCVARAFGWLF